MTARASLITLLMPPGGHVATQDAAKEATKEVAADQPASPSRRRLFSTLVRS